MTTYSQIYSSLQAQLLTIDNLPARAAPNVPFKPVLGSPFIRDTFMPVESANGTIGVNGWEIPQGLYQIDVFYPVNVSTSVELALALADTIIETYQRATIPTAAGSITITKAWQGMGRTHDEFYHIPVMVRFSVYGG